MTTGRRHAAVIGSGVAGLTAAYVLATRYDVTVYEADDRIGGHAHTHDVPVRDGRVLGVDSGFIVHNERTYPRLLRLFRELGVATQDSEMSMSVRCDGCGLEYAGARGPRGLFARPSAVLRPRYLRMLTEVPRLHRRARRLLDAPEDETDQLTLRQFLRAGAFSSYFVAHFVTPLVSAVWSCGPDQVGHYPARYLFRFLDHHGLLSTSGSPPWKTVTGGSRDYVARLAARLTAVRTGTPVRAVRRYSDRADVTSAAGERATFDAVVVATHPDQALRMLVEPSRAEREVLGAFRYSRNPTVLHTDPTVLPNAAAARASWNYLMPDCSASADRVLVSYHMNRLQRFREPKDYVVTLNGAQRVPPERVLASMVYEHPLYTLGSAAAQRRLPELATPVCAFAGAYHGWGFHEDGCRSGVAAAGTLGVRW